MSGNISDLDDNFTDSSDPMGPHRRKDVFVFTYMSVMGVVCVTGNILVIVTVAKIRKQQTVTSLFLTNMAIADFCLGITLMPWLAHSSFIGKWTFGPVVCKIVTYLLKVFIIASNSSVTLIAVDRYLSIIHCLRYTSWSHRTYGGLSLCFVWLEAILSPVPQLLDISHHPSTCLQSLSSSLPHAILMSIAIFGIPFLVTSYCHLMIIKVARSHARKICDIHSQMNRRHAAASSNGIVALACVDPVRRLSLMGLPSANTCATRNNIDLDLYSLGNGSHLTTGDDNRIKRELVAVVRLVALILVLCCIWCPVIVIEMSHYTDKRNPADKKKNEILCKLAFCLIALHCSLNPFLYVFNAKQFRKQVLNLICASHDRREAIQTTKLVSLMNNRNKTKQQTSVHFLNRKFQSCEENEEGNIFTLSSPPLDEIEMKKRLQLPRKLRFKEHLTTQNNQIPSPKSLSSIPEIAIETIHLPTVSPNMPEKDINNSSHESLAT